MSWPGVVRECEHPGHPHEHGLACYQNDLCRCDAGRAASALRKREERRALAYGHGPKLIDATGTRRRIQALMMLGYDQTVLGAELGLTRYGVSQIIDGRHHRVQRRKARMIAALYDRWWDKPAPDSYASQYVRKWAECRGWAPPMAWDDDGIDDPLCLPYGLPPIRIHCPTCFARPSQQCINLARGASRRPRRSLHVERIELATREEAA